MRSSTWRDDTLVTNEDTAGTINVLTNDSLARGHGHRRHPGRQRHGDVPGQRHCDLHPGHRLQRQRQLYLHRHHRRWRHRDGHGQRHRQRGRRRGGRHAGHQRRHGRHDQRADQRHVRCRGHGHRCDPGRQRHGDVPGRWRRDLHAGYRLQRQRQLYLHRHHRCWRHRDRHGQCHRQRGRRRGERHAGHQRRHGRHDQRADQRQLWRRAPPSPV